MSFTYATYSEFTEVYSLKGVTEAEINSYWLPHGALRLNESLGACGFTLPFSSNNQTAKDLSIHLAFLGIQARSRTGQTVDIKIKNEIEQRITAISCGNAPMITDTGEALFADGTKFDTWSNTQNYISTFNMLDPVDQRIDPDDLCDTHIEVWH